MSKEQHLIKFYLTKEAKQQIAAFLKVTYRALYKHTKTLPEDAYKGQLLISSFLMPEVLNAKELKGLTALPQQTQDIEGPEVAEAEEAPVRRRKRVPKEVAKKLKAKNEESEDSPKKKKAQAGTENMLNAQEAADALGITRNLLGYHVHRGNLKNQKVEGRLFFAKDELKRFKEQHLRKTA